MGVVDSRGHCVARPPHAAHEQESATKSPHLCATQKLWKGTCTPLAANGPLGPHSRGQQGT